MIYTPEAPTELKITPSDISTGFFPVDQISTTGEMLIGSYRELIDMNDWLGRVFVSAGKTK